PQVQLHNCSANSYKNKGLTSCTRCTRRHGRQECRFKGIRTYREINGRLTHAGFVYQSDDVSPPFDFPKSWNVCLSTSHIAATKQALVGPLLSILHEERQHLNMKGVIYRPREVDFRVVCDTCSTSIFSRSWLCSSCGREVCNDCLTKIRGLASQESINEQVYQEGDINLFILNCVHGLQHDSSQFHPITRFQNAELEEAISEMEIFNFHSESPKYPLPEAICNLSEFTKGMSHLPSFLPAQFLPNNVVSHHAFTEAVFGPIWARGEPIVVTQAAEGIRDWSPEYFIANYGEETCKVTECQSGIEKNSTLSTFFEGFVEEKAKKKQKQNKKNNENIGCLKLKDWPPTGHFEEVCPELDEQFRHAVPIPNYVRRDGVLNIASHFPPNMVPPDLGPKMYIAHRNPKGTKQGSQGSTRLHMDMADAVNIMTYAASTNGCAVWDIFRAEDSLDIRTFLQQNFPSVTGDPIHSHQIYMDDEMLRRLRKSGVVGYRVFQKPGDAIFIPAGCAHQVCNLDNCIKVAIDFVSPQNVARCRQLTREFRQFKTRREDVLQLHTMMWFAWLSCRGQEKQLRTTTFANDTS
ncbi:Clavaminate synthase-like protein, partial [Mycena crocata]